MDGWIDGWMDMNIYNVQFLQPRQSRVHVDRQQWTDESSACCKTESVLVSNLKVMAADNSRAEEHMKQNCAARRWWFLLPGLASLPVQQSTGDGDWHWLPVRQRLRFKLACIIHVQVTIWSGHRSTWSIMFSYLLTADGVYFDQTTTEHASFHGHRTVSATEPFLLPDLKSGTICHRNCDTWTSALDNSETC